MSTNEFDDGRALRSGSVTNGNAAGVSAGKTNPGMGGATAGGKKRRAVPGESTLHRMIREARYEYDIDPYRGMMRYAGTDHADENAADRAARVAAVPSPWESSCRLEGAADENVQLDETAGATLIQMVCQNQCPCLIAWTDQQMQKKKTKKRKKGSEDPNQAIGGRPDDAQRCRCDYNPFCLGTLGGAMNEVWQRRLQNISGDSSQPTQDSLSDSNEVIIDLQESGSEDNNAVIARKQQTFSADPNLEESKTLYNHRTWVKLRSLRDSAVVDSNKIRAYLHTTLQGLTSIVSVDTCMQRIEEWNNQLLFGNPLLDVPIEEEQVRLAVPPGIENLGATCYLNTQLQCLAQIDVFLKGMFSWHAAPVQLDDKVTEVLGRFQRILASLHAGAQRQITTVEFSNALGIDHFEQQDPNEFSRLFFDLLHTKFKEDDSSGPGGLADLLPNLFQGMRKYQTICQDCNKVSERKEAFMDLNLPIAKRSEEDAFRKTGQQSILECLGGQISDTDVQYLFDLSCRDELLEGDNQYFCEGCGCKTDACRRVRFEKVPPLLNIQLSRYIFDLKSLAKKKVSEKVLLPRELQVESESEGAEQPAQHRYVLCAVMIHKGKSAYSGHYVAQAMNWVTGCWFEFNDIHVKLLKDGPECSFDPTAEAGKLRKGLIGSQDAYNLYYVEENFLAQSVMERIRTLANKDQATLLNETAAERATLYKELYDACIKNSEAAERLKGRRNYILNELFRPDRPFEALVDHVEPPPVWVPGIFLRRYFSCSDPFEDELAHDVVEDVIKGSDHLCLHGQRGLHPRVARKGKLLPRVMYETIVASLFEERASLLGGEVENENQDGFVVTPLESMYCQECVDEFHLDVRTKLALVEDYLFLYEELDTKSEDAPVTYGADTDFECHDNKYVYLVARKFCTALRDHIKQIMKKIAPAGAESFAIDEKLLPKYESIAEGLDALQMEDLEIKGSPGDNDESVDTQVNNAITCTHGICTRHTKQFVRFVSWRVWERITKLFPHAIQHPVPRKRSDQNEDADCPLLEPCSQCAEDGSMTDNLSKQLSVLAKASSKLAESNGADEDDVVFADHDDTFYAVHVDDWKAFRKFTTTFRRKAVKAEPREIREEVLRCLKPHEALLQIDNDEVSTAESLNEIDRRTVELFRKLVKPLKCLKHRLPALDALTVRASEPPKISSKIRLLAKSSYRKYILSLFALSRTLVQSEDGGAIDVVDESGEFIVEGMMGLCERQGLFDWHPRLAQAPSQCPSLRSIVIESDRMSTFMVSHSDFCRENECFEQLEKLFPAEPKQNGQETTAESAGNAADPITIDVDDGGASGSRDTFSLTVFEAEASASEESIMEALTQYANVSNGTEKDVAANGLRRSSRRRKTRLPAGVLETEETVQTNICHNVAALRLLLFQSCTQGSQFSPEHRLILVVSPVESKAEPDGNAKPSIPVSLDFALNETTLFSICQQALGDDLSVLSIPESLVLVRQADFENEMDLGKDDLMAHLISLSNAGSPDSNEKKRKARVVERGFTGTLLSTGQGNVKKIRSDDGKEESENGFAGSVLSSGSGSVNETRDSHKKEQNQDSLEGADSSECRALVLVNNNQINQKREERSPATATVFQNDQAAMEVASDTVLIHDDTRDGRETTRILLGVMNRLEGNPHVESNHTAAVRQASKWAVREHPAERDVDSLANMAYAKYVEFTLNATVEIAD